MKLFKNCFLKSFGGVLISALLLTVSFPPFNVNFFIFVFIVPAIYSIYCIEKNKKKVIVSVFWGLLIFVFTLYWTIFTIHHFGKINFILSTLIFIPLAIYQTIPFIIWLYFFKYQYEKSILIPCLTFPLLENFMPLIFPYSLSSSLAYSNYLPQFASVVGEWGLDFLIIFVNVCIFKSINEKNKRILIYPTIIFLFLIGFGLFKVNLSKPENGKKLEIVVVQPNILDSDSDNTSNKKLFSMIAKINGKCKGKTVIFPESAIPDGIGVRKDFFKVMNEIRSQLNADRIIYNHTVLKNGKFYNTSFLTSADKTEFYFKNKLMLFGEKFPFHWIIKKLPLYVANFASFDSGKELKVLESGNVKFATPICLEAVYQNYTAELSKTADVIVNQTNDEWFGKTRATYLHFSQVKMKAIECGKYLIRATNTGYTTIIDNYGREINSLDINKQGYLEASVKLLKSETYFSIIHKYIPYLYLISILCIFIFHKLKKGTI